jgi:hypothetical protein
VTEVANPNQDARSKGNGRYVRTPETAQRDAEAARLRGEGLTLREIAEHLGYGHISSVDEAIARAYRDLAGPAKLSRERRTSELDMLWEYAQEIVDRRHITVSNGKVITMRDPETGEDIPLPDDGPRLQAITELRRINESRRKLDGDDAPSRVSVEAETLGREIGRLLDAAFGQDGADDDES